MKEALYNTYIMDVNLLTIHQSKGLEFKAVFIIGLNEGILQMDEIEEESDFFMSQSQELRIIYIC